MIGITEASEGFSNPSSIEEIAELLDWHPFADVFTAIWGEGGSITLPIPAPSQFDSPYHIDLDDNLLWPMFDDEETLDPETDDTYNQLIADRDHAAMLREYSHCDENYQRTDNEDFLF